MEKRELGSTKNIIASVRIACFMLCATALFFAGNAQGGTTMNQTDLSNSVIFPVGEKLASEHFTGVVWLKMLTPADSTCPIGNVTFEPGCRNSWHSHAGGQVLLVTGGRGWYQQWGKPAQELHPGDVVNIPPDVKHWHGAAKDSWFAHLAVTVDPGKGPATWLEPVADADYDALN